MAKLGTVEKSAVKDATKRATKVMRAFVKAVKDADTKLSTGQRKDLYETVALEILCARGFTQLTAADL